MSAGPEYSRFWFAAQKYKEILARNGVTLRVLTSSGTLENLVRLADPASHVDLGFVQSGLTSIPSVVSPDTRRVGLMSLGSVSNWPLFVWLCRDKVDKAKNSSMLSIPYEISE